MQRSFSISSIRLLCLYVFPHHVQQVLIWNRRSLTFVIRIAILPRLYRNGYAPAAHF